MEILLLGVTIGAALTMVCFALKEGIALRLAFVVVPVLVILLWHWWGTVGVFEFANRTVERISAHVLTRGAQSDGGIKVDESSNDPVSVSTLGQVGDLFGGINALFAALAFAGVALASYMQARALELSRRQYSQQSFEPLFFCLLQLHRDSSAARVKLAAAFAREPQSEVPERDAEVVFSRAIAVLRRKIRLGAVGFTDQNERPRQLKVLCESIYSTFYEANQAALGIHFRTLLEVFTLIDVATLDDRQKVAYANIARSTLNEDLVFLLAVHSLTMSDTKLYYYVNRFGFLCYHAKSAQKQTIDEILIGACFQPSAIRQ